MYEWFLTLPNIKYSTLGYTYTLLRLVQVPQVGPEQKWLPKQASKLPSVAPALASGGKMRPARMRPSING